MIDARITDALRVLDDPDMLMSDRVYLAADLLRGDAILTPTPAAEAAIPAPRPAEGQRTARRSDVIRFATAVGLDPSRVKTLTVIDGWITGEEYTRTPIPGGEGQPIADVRLGEPTWSCFAIRVIPDEPAPSSLGMTMAEAADAAVALGRAISRPDTMPRAVAERVLGFRAIPSAARDTAAQALADTWREWDDNADCGAMDEDHNHENCGPMGWWPSRDVVAATAIRALVDAGWTLTPPEATR